jgi:hypothetical protein
VLPGDRSTTGRGPLPIDPGSWGRPAVAPIDSPPLPSWVPVGAPPPPPPPPLAKSPRSSAGSAFSARVREWSWTHGRRRRALIEGGVAIAILLALALAGRPGGASQAQVGSSALTEWGQTAGPAITNLIDDVKTIEGGTRPDAGVPPDQLRAEALRYQADLAAATQLGRAPDRAIAESWSAALLQLAAAAHVLSAAQPSDPATTARAHVRFAAAEEELLRLEQELASRA